MVASVDSTDPADSAHSHTVKHLISAISNFRGVLKMTNWRILILGVYTIAPDSKEHLLYLSDFP